jgi:hypothetical protein
MFSVVEGGKGGNKEYYVAVLNAGTEFTSTSPSYYELKTSAIVPKLYNYSPSNGFITSSYLYSCNEDPSGDVSITKIDRGTYTAEAKSFTSLTAFQS